MIKEKPKPRPGMKVRWIAPSSDRKNSQYIRGWMKTYGKEDMQVVRVHNRQAGTLVTLTRGKRTVGDVWIKKNPPKPDKKMISPLVINWHYLRPALKKK